MCEKNEFFEYTSKGCVVAKLIKTIIDLQKGY